MPPPRIVFFTLALLGSLLPMTSCPAANGPGIPPAGEFFVFYGIAERTAGKGISLGRFNSSTGTLTTPALAVEAFGPSFFTLSADRRFLYACHEPAAEIAAYAVDQTTGALRLLNKLPSGGGGPCHISLDRTGRFALVANYNGGSVAVFALAPDGSLGTRTAFDQHMGTGPHPRQEGPHAHGILTDPSNRFAFCADLGTDKIYIYRFDEKTGGLTPSPNPGPDKASPPYGTVTPGAGPRHLVFSPDGKALYCLNELNGTLTAFSWDAASGRLTETQTIATLPDGFAGANLNAEIQLHPNGRFLYTSARGHDAIAVFAINPATGRLTLVQDMPNRGKTPRYFGFDPTGQWIISGNQESNTAVVFKVDSVTGRLTPSGEPVTAPGPICMAFIPVPPAR